jgi:rSAM/selenodomain-associated transferase 1
MDFKNVLLIFVKYPLPGIVKRRLAKTIGRDAAACLYRMFVEVILKRTECGDFSRIVFFTPAARKQETARWLGEEIDILPQSRGDLGARLSMAFKQVFGLGGERVVVIGTDSPLIDKRIVSEAFKKLKHNDCVIGPSLDGGYYLLGLSHFYREIFQGINWGSRDVFNQTKAAVDRLKIKVSVLNKCFDIDDMDDLKQLSRSLKHIRGQNRKELLALKEVVKEAL